MHFAVRSKVSFLLALLVLLALVATLLLSTVLRQQTHATAAHPVSSNVFHFKMVPASAPISQCLPRAQGDVTITTNTLNDSMKVSVKGLVPNTGYDLFVIEIPKAPFGISWYQTDLETDSSGAGTVTVIGIFDRETFSVSPGGPTVKFPPTHQYHLGLWFNDPQVPFKQGCEPGAKSPIVTPFNGEQHAGIQVLNTSNFPDNAGPLSHVHR